MLPVLAGMWRVCFVRDNKVNITRLQKDVEKIYLNRKKIYALSDYRLNCANKSIKQIASEIKKIYENL